MSESRALTPDEIAHLADESGRWGLYYPPAGKVVFRLPLPTPPEQTPPLGGAS